MSGEIPSLGLHKGKSWTEWTKLVSHANYMSDLIETEANPPVRLLPRKDIYVYGTCPKTDIRVLCHCEKCGKVLMPQSFFETHQKVKHGPEQQLSSITSQASSKKKSSHSKNKKKTHLPPPPSLFPKTPMSIHPPTPVPPTAIELPPPILQPVQVPLPATSPPSSRHKKSKKSSKKGKEFDPEKHCGFYDANKGPCLQPIGCTNHLAKKSLVGKSKEVMATDQKAVKEQESSIKGSIITPKIIDTSAMSTSQVKNMPMPFVKITPVSTSMLASIKKDMPVISQAAQVSISPCTTTNTPTTVNSQGKVSPSSVVYMPMSPVAVVGPVQFVQLGGPLLRVASTQPLLSPPLATQPIVVTIPVPNSSSVYTPHPKPIAMCTSSTRRIGGSLLLQSQRVDRQRNEIHMAANTRRVNNNTCSVMNTHPHRPNILKNSAKNNVRYSNLKRPAATDKVVESKQIRISTENLNGFIYTDVTDATEPPQNNNSVHEKITLINTK